MNTRVSVSAVTIAEVGADLGRGYRGSVASMQRGDGRVFLPSSGPAVTEILAATCRFLGVPFEIVASEPAVSARGGQLTSLEDRDAVLREVYREVHPGRYAAAPDSLRSELIEACPVILSVSPDGLAAASQYGILTGRPVLHLERAGAEKDLFLATRGARSLYVSTGPALTVDRLRGLLAAKAAADNRAAIGFFYPFGAVESESFPLKSFLHGKCLRGPQLPYALFYPLEGRKDRFTVDGVDFVVGKGALPAEAEELLTRPNEYLFSTPHSNGLDMSLGHVVICARADHAPASPPPARAMPCFYADVCCRKTPANTLLAPSSIRSVVVFLYTCWGVLLENAVHDVDVSLGRFFARSPFNAALLTTYTMSLLDRAAGLFVAESYSRGDSIGACAATLNRLHFERYRDQRDVVVLFGDPELRASEPRPLPLSGLAREHPGLSRLVRDAGIRLYVDDGGEPRAAATPLAPLPAAVPAQLFRALDYSRCVVNATRPSAKGVALRAATDALSARVEDVWTFAMLFNGRRRQDELASFKADVMLEGLDRRVAALQGAWFDFYRAMNGELGGLVRLQLDRFFGEPEEGGAPPAPCPYCEGAIHRAVQSMFGSPARRRQLECYRCGTIFDGLASFQEGRIVCDERWKRGAPARVALEARCKGLWPGHLAAAMLEPFVKNRGDEVLASVAQSQGPLEGGVHRISLPPLHVPDTLLRGSCHLNALLVGGASVLFLRREIYLD